jgi:hypothetical protein
LTQGVEMLAIAGQIWKASDEILTTTPPFPCSIPDAIRTFFELSSGYFLVPSWRFCSNSPGSPNDQFRSDQVQCKIGVPEVQLRMSQKETVCIVRLRIQSSCNCHWLLEPGKKYQ